MSETGNQIFKNDNLKRVMYFLSIFFFIPAGLALFGEGISGDWVIVFGKSIAIPQPFSSILLILIGIALAIGWSILAINIVTYVLTINQTNFQQKALLKKDTAIDWNQVKKVVQYKNRKRLTKLVLYLSNGQKTTLDMKNFSKQNKSDIVSLLKSHTT